MLTLPTTLRVTAAQFAEVCAANPEAVLELEADGRLIEITPAGGETGSRNQTLGALLWMAVRQGGLPLKVCDSSTGFQLPDGSIRSPDASLGWLLLPESRSVEVWSAVDPADDPGRQASPEELLPQRITAARRLDASPLFPGLALDLEEIWVA